MKDLSGDAAPWRASASDASCVRPQRIGYVVKLSFRRTQKLIFRMGEHRWFAWLPTMCRVAANREL
jgi:hypothetical protein